MKERFITCSVCFNVTDQDPCAICRDPSRDHSRVCVVEQPFDVVALERAGKFRGLYHVLHGAINYMEGVTPQQLKIGELLKRAESAKIAEVILATDSSTEGDATAMYIARHMAKLGVSTTRVR